MDAYNIFSNRVISVLKGGVMERVNGDQILKLIVEDFIELAEPIGSQTLLVKHNLPCSSATIRNIMVNLEKDGLIEKPHHSSGRVPSAKGYKYYLKKLKENRNTYEVDDEFKKEFALMLNKKSKTVEDVMEESCMILSQMTSLATVVLGPEASRDELAAIQVVPLSERSLTAIIVTSKGYVENKTFVLESAVGSEDVKKVVEILNKRLVGTAIEDVSEKMNLLKPLVSELLGERTNMIMEAFTEAFLKFAKKRLETFGASKLVELPEYSNDTSKLKDIIDLLDDPKGLQERLDELDEVGFEVNEENDTAIVTTNVKFGQNGQSRLAVVGPRRMNYRKILASLEYIAHTLEKYYSGLEGFSEEEDE